MTEKIEADESVQDEPPSELTKFSPLEVAQIVRDAAKEAKDSGDYISYATVLEEHLTLRSPKYFSDEDRQCVLSALLDVVSADDELVYQIGWDIPSLLLNLVEGEYDFATGIRSVPHIVLTLRIFNVVCEKGNQKELFLKGVEAIARLRMAETAPDSAENLREQYFDFKFYLAYELMFHSIRTVDTLYPSRFLATAITALLSFFAANLNELSLLSLSVILRRLFVFARDYELRPDPSKPVTEYELSLVRQLLQSFPSWTIDIAFQRFNIQWSKRLYHELKAGLALADFSVREKANTFQLEDHTARVNECSERLAQLTFSLDLDILQQLKDLIDKAPIQGDQSDEEESNETKSKFSSLSEEGMLLIATQIRFDYRTTAKPELTLHDVIKLTKRFVSVTEGPVSLGVADALIFWGLWATKSITEHDVQQIGQSEFAEYLQQIMMLSATSADKDFRYLAFSLAAKLLGLHKPEVSFEIVTDTIEHCPYENIQDATIRILKGLCMPKRRVSRPAVTVKADTYKAVESTRPVASTDSIETLTEEVKELNIDKSTARIHLEDAKRLRVQGLVEETTQDVFDAGYQSEKVPLLLGWLNFLNVIETDKAFLEPFLGKVKNLIEQLAKDQDKNREQDITRLRNILELAVESVSKRWL